YLRNEGATHASQLFNAGITSSGLLTSCCHSSRPLLRLAVLRSFSERESVWSFTRTASHWTGSPLKRIISWQTIPFVCILESRRWIQRFRIWLRTIRVPATVCLVSRALVRLNPAPPLLKHYQAEEQFVMILAAGLMFLQ